MIQDLNSVYNYETNSDNCFSFERVRTHEFGHAEYSTNKSINYGIAKEFLGVKMGISTPHNGYVDITTEQHLSFDTSMASYVGKKSLNSPMIEIVLKCNIKTADEIESAVNEKDSEIYKLLHGPNDAGKYNVSNLLRSRENSLKLQISSKGNSITRHIAFKIWVDRLRSALEATPAMVEVLDRGISLAMSTDRGAILANYPKPFEADDFEMNNPSFLKIISNKYREVQGHGPDSTSVVLRMSEDHKIGCTKIHAWLNFKLHSIIESAISNDILKQLTTSKCNSGTHMIVELFRRYGKFEPRELKDVEDQLNKFVFTPCEDETDPFDAEFGINKFKELYSLLLGQKPGCTEQSGISYLLSSIETDPEYSKLTDSANSNSRRINGGYQTLEHLYEDIKYIHTQYKRIGKKRKMQETRNAKPKGNANGKPSEKPKCGNPNCGGRHKTSDCFSLGGAKYNPNYRSRKGNQNGKPSGKQNGKPSDDRPECETCGLKSHKTSDCYRPGGVKYDPNFRSKKQKNANGNSAQHNSTVEVTTLSKFKGRWGKGIGASIEAKQIHDDSDSDDEGRNPKHKREKDSA